MNKDKVYNTEPGRKRDALVAERAMGWEWNIRNPLQSLLYSPDGTMGAVIFYDGSDGEGLIQVLNCPFYSTDIAAAFEVHTYLLSQGPAIKAAYLHALADVLTDKYGGPPSVWTASLECFDADTISYAALIAVG